MAKKSLIWYFSVVHSVFLFSAGYVAVYPSATVEDFLAQFVFQEKTL